jgi:hypothetical protein
MGQSCFFRRNNMDNGPAVSGPQSPQMKKAGMKGWDQIILASPRTGLNSIF